MKQQRRYLLVSIQHPVLLLFLTSFLLFSCGTIPRNYPIGKPFVFKTTIKVVGSAPKEQRDLLQNRLRGQLDDSLRSRTVSKLFYSTLRKPPVYDSTYAIHSIEYMHALLNSLGYFRDKIRYDTTRTVINKNQIRTTVNFSVDPGNPFLLDTINYVLQDATLQQLTIDNKPAAKIKTGDPFAKGIIGEELDRLIDHYRNNGYLRLTRDDLVGIWDTLDLALLKPIADPLEQLKVFQQVRERSATPTANLEIRLRPETAKEKLIQYKVGKITLFPDFTSDTAGLKTTSIIQNGVQLERFRPIFKDFIFKDKIHFKTGQIYDQRNYFKTLNQLNAMGGWRLVNLETIPRKNQDTTDILIKLTPARKYTSFANLEGSSNQSLLAGTLFGVALNVGFQNRNLFRRSIQSTTNLRLGVEIGRDTIAAVNFIQTRQIALTHNLIFPGLLPRFAGLPADLRQHARSILAFNISNTERRELFNLSSYSAAWGYDFRYKNTLYTIRIPNIEYNAIARRAKLLALIDSNALLKNIFVDGLIISGSAGLFYSRQKANQIRNLRLNIEESGILSGFIRSPLLDSNLFRFIKVDLDLSTKYTFKKTALALRFFAGAGYAFDQTRNPVNRYNLPLYRQYFAGGPNSMRAWGLRKLGPGSSIQEYGNKGLPERYGDLQLEGNIEFRFPWFNIAGMQVNGAVFADAGNIWYLKKTTGRTAEEIFSLRRLGQDLAVGVGTGLRLDFTYFVIRLDYSLKAKDPSPSPANRNYQNKWFGYPRLRDMDQFQLGINYPFNL